MKTKIFLFVLILLALAGLEQAKSQEPLPDTVWTKRMPDEITCVKFSKNGESVAVAVNGNIYILNTITGDTIRTYKGHTSQVLSIDFSSTGDTMLSAAGEVILWNYITGERLKTYNNIFYKAYFMQDDSKIITLKTPMDSNCLAIINKSTGELINGEVFPEIPNFIYSRVNNLFCISQAVYFPSEGKRKGYLKLWDAQTFEKIADLGNHEDQITDMAFSPDGSLLATSSWDRTVKIWNVENKELEQIINIPQDFLGFYGVNFSNDNKYLLITGASYEFSIKIFDIYNKNYSNQYYFPGDILSIEISSDDKYILCNDAYSLRLFNANLTSIGSDDMTFDMQSTLYPNPTNNLVNIKFDLKSFAEIDIQLTDLKGKYIDNIYNGILEQGVQNIPYNCSKLPAGVYIIRIISPSFTQTFKLVKEC